MEKILLDREGYEQFINEIETLKQKLKKVLKQKSESVKGANIHDNFDFEESKREADKIQLQIKLAYEKLERVVIVEKGTDESIIDIGDYVRVIRDYGDEQFDDIVHLTAKSSAYEHESYIPTSINSPIGSAIYKKTIGSKVPFTVENDTYFVTIKSKLTKEEIKELVGFGLRKTLD